MSRDENITSIALYGDAKTNSLAWQRWLITAKAIMETIGYPVSHIGLTGDSFKSEKVFQFCKVEKRIMDALTRGVAIQDMALQSLIDKYRSAAFDYNCNLLRTDKMIHLEVGSTKYAELDEESIIRELSQHIQVDRGQVFSMDRKETPLIYVMGANPIESFRSLKIIRSF